MTTLRELLGAGRMVVAPGAFDPFTARIIERLGFPAVYLGGHAMGIHLVVGQPFVTLGDTLDCAARVLRAIDVPLIVDADSGFGDAAHVHRTVRDFARSGVAAIHIDDQPFPKRAHYHLGRGTLSPETEVVEKLRFAVNARAASDLLLIARTDALRVTGSVEETLERCRAYAATGIDALMVLDLGPEQAPAFRRAFPDLPLVWIGGTSAPMPAVDDLRQAGFALAVYPFNAAAAVTDAVSGIWSALRDSGRPDQSAELLARTRTQVLELLGMEEYWEIERQTTERKSR